MPGDTPHHTERWRSCVEQVQEKNPDANAHAICTAQLGPSLLSETSDSQPFVWNGGGCLGKPFKRRDLDSAATSKAWETRRRAAPAGVAPHVAKHRAQAEEERARARHHERRDDDRARAAFGKPYKKRGDT